MTSKRWKFSSRICPVNDFLTLVQVKAWTLDEADEVVFNFGAESTRIRSHFKGADTTLFKPFCCPTFGETLRSLLASAISVTRLSPTKVW
jgi:hypothetical protein